MATSDTCCSVVPYFKAHAGRISALRALCEQAVEQTRAEPGCLYYGFSFDGDEVHCREAYANADAVLTHLGNIAPVIGKMFEVSDMTRLEVHGPEAEIAKLREPMAQFNPRFFVLEYGFRR